MRFVALAVLTLLLVAGCGSEQTEQSEQQSYRWTLLTNWQDGSPAAEAAHNLAERLQRASGGRLQVELQNTDEAVFTAVASGRAQLGHSAPGISAQYVPAAQLFMSVPFGMDADQFSAWIYDGGGLQLWRELYAAHRLVPYLAGHGGMQMAGWYNREIKSPASLQGMKVRSSGIGALVLERLGAVPLSLPSHQTAQALRASEIDAVVWNRLTDGLDGEIDTLAAHLYYPGWQAIDSTLELLVNQDALNTLPQDLREIVRIVCIAEAHRVALEQTEADRRALTAKPLPDAVVDALASASRDQLRELAEQDADFARVYRSYKEFLLQTLAVYEIGEDQILELQRP